MDYPTLSCANSVVTGLLHSRFPAFVVPVFLALIYRYLRCSGSWLAVLHILLMTLTTTKQRYHPPSLQRGLNICPVICRTVFQCSENPRPSAATIYADKCSFPRYVSHFLNSQLEEEKKVQAESPAASPSLLAPCSCFWSL